MSIYKPQVSKVSNALNTLVSREKPGFQALSKGLVVLLRAEVVGKEFQTMGSCTANARRPKVDSRRRGTTISCCLADLRRCLPTTWLCDRCATVDKVLRSLAMPIEIFEHSLCTCNAKVQTYSLKLSVMVCAKEVFCHRICLLATYGI